MTANPPLDAAYIDKKRKELLRMRGQLLRARETRAGEEGGVEGDALASAREYEDDAQKLATLELDSNLDVHDDTRLAQIDRALAKIDDGTYGFSDASGDPIPRARLDVLPDALYTIAEQERLEKR